MANTTKPSGMREGYLKWNDYFMGIALLASQRSKDPKTQVGACIVNKQNQIVGIGYNGLAPGVNDKDRSWGGDKSSYVIHAVDNAIKYALSEELKECTLYVTLFPHEISAANILDKKIKEIVYMSDKEYDKPEVIDSKLLLDGVTLTQYVPSCKGLRLDFINFDNQQIEQL